jgi:hypothetical protein
VGAFFLYDYYNADHYWIQVVSSGRSVYSMLRSVSYLYLDTGENKCPASFLQSHVSSPIHMGFIALAIRNRVGHEAETITYQYAYLFSTV